MTAAASIREAHRECGCFSQDRLDATGDAALPISHQGCQLRIRGLRLAINCDQCRVYGPNDVRPDLLVLRERNGTCEWVVIEIQRTMDRAARRQVEAGLETIARSPLFESFRTCRPRALFASTRRVRAQEIERLRR